MAHSSMSSLSLLQPFIVAVEAFIMTNWANVTETVVLILMKVTRLNNFDHDLHVPPLIVYKIILLRL